MTGQVRFYGTLITACNIAALRCQGVLILVTLDLHLLYQASILHRNIHNIHLRMPSAFMKRTLFLKLNWKHLSESKSLIFIRSKMFLFPYRGAFNSLVQSLGSGPTSQVQNHQQLDVKSENPQFSLNSYLPPKILRQEDYPNIKYWYKHQWNSSKSEVVSSSEPGERGRSRAAQGKNVTMGFVEDIDGQAIDGHRASNIRKATRQIWEELAASGLAPKTWSKIGINALTRFRHQMYEQFPELTYCDNHWKLDRLATDTYSQWDGNKLSSSSESLPSPKNMKRGSAEHDPRPLAKKQKPGSKLKKSNSK